MISCPALRRTPLARPTPPRSWRFDDFVLDTARYELRRGDTVIRVEPQVFDVLTQLIAHHERFVSKEELFDSVWGGRFVGEAALTSRIKAARHALGDDGESQRYIRTVRGRGYQFVGTLHAEPAWCRREPEPGSCRRVSTSRSAVRRTGCAWPRRGGGPAVRARQQLDDPPRI